MARLRSESGDLEAAAVFLQELVRGAPDEASRAEYQGALDEIEVEWRARILDRSRITYRERWGRDIDSVEQLAVGPEAVLAELPSAEPSSLPAPLRRGSVWIIDEATGEIQSSYYERRYRVHGQAMRSAAKARMKSSDSAAPEAPASDDRAESGKPSAG